MIKGVYTGRQDTDGNILVCIGMAHSVLRRFEFLP